MVKFSKVALRPAALILTAAGLFAAARAQTYPLTEMVTDGHNMLFLDGTGRSGPVEILLDGVTVSRGMVANDRPILMVLAPGSRTLSVRGSDGRVLASTVVNVVPGTRYALSFNNDGATTYKLVLGTGTRSIRSMLDGNGN